MIITLFIQLELYQFKTLFSKTMEEFGLENHFDDFKKIDEDLKKDSKMMYRVSLDFIQSS